MSTLKDYLAKNYLSGTSDSSHSSKPKRKKPKQPKGSTTNIVDEEADDWKRTARRDDSDDETPVVVDGIHWEGDDRGAKNGSGGDGNLGGPYSAKANWRRVGAGDDDSDVDEMKGATIVDLGNGVGESGGNANRGSRAQHRRETSEPRRRHDSESEGEGVKGNATRGRNVPGGGEARSGRRRHDSDSEVDAAAGRREADQHRKRPRHDSDIEEERGGTGKRGGPPLSPDPRTRPRQDSPSTERLDKPAPSNSSKKLQMADGTHAGLQRASDVAKQAAARREEEDSRLRRMDTRASGKDADTVYRDKSGRKVNPALEKAETLERQRKEEAELERQMQWGRGLAQMREAENRAKQLSGGGALPMARYADDRDMNEAMKVVDRWGDPMAGMVRKKVKVNRPVYKGPLPAPNRFGIAPGYRWDGVDRSNGFESDFFKRKNDKIALREEAHKWSAEDM
ncbi:bud site selection protein [Gonapodya sp. JEL0774]|nr:bud site selection protein [Gonapodya sp. JEL0774]